MITYFRTPEVTIMGKDSVLTIGKEAKKLNATNVLLVADDFLIKNHLLTKIEEALTSEGIQYTLENRIIPEPPFELLYEIAEDIRQQDYDLMIGVGGGSVLDSTKLLAILYKKHIDLREMVGTDKIQEKGLPFILVPTTAGTGSEVTWNSILTDNHDKVKKGIVSPYLLPQVAIVDPEMTKTMPASVTAATGMDALVHAIESYTSLRTDPLNDGIALHAIKLINRSLRKAVYNGEDDAARADMSYGSLLAGISLANAGVGGVHALAYPLGGKFKVPHGVSNSLLLSYVMEFNVVSEFEKFKDIAIALGENIAGLSNREAAFLVVENLKNLAKDIGIPSSLREVGVTEEDIPGLAEEAIKIERLLANNPRKLTLKDIETIYYNALG